MKLGKGATLDVLAFGESGVTKVEILGTVTVDNGNVIGGVSVGAGAFYGCTKLTNIDFGKIVGSIGDSAFYGCVGITSVIAPYVTEIGEEAFFRQERKSVV